MFRDWDAQNSNNATPRQAIQSFTAQGLKQSVDIPLQPLDASNIPPYVDGTSYYSLALPMVQEYYRDSLFVPAGTVCPQKNCYEKGTLFPYSKSIGAFNVGIG